MSFSFLLTLDKRNVNFIFNVESVNNRLNYLILRQRLHICMRYGALQCSFTENIFHLELNILSDIPPFDVVIISAISPEMNSFTPFLVLSTLQKLLFNFIKTLSC